MCSEKLWSQFVHFWYFWYHSVPLSYRKPSMKLNKFLIKSICTTHPWPVLVRGSKSERVSSGRTWIIYSTESAPSNTSPTNDDSNLKLLFPDGHFIWYNRRSRTWYIARPVDSHVIYRVYPKKKTKLANAVSTWHFFAVQFTGTVSPVQGRSTVSDRHHCRQGANPLLVFDLVLNNGGGILPFGTHRRLSHVLHHVIPGSLNTNRWRGFAPVGTD